MIGELTEIGVEAAELLGDVSLGDHTKVVRVVEEVVVEGEVTAWIVSQCARTPGESCGSRGDDVDASLLDGLPSLLADGLGGGSEVVSRRVAGPVRLDGLEEVSHVRGHSAGGSKFQMSKSGSGDD